MYARRSRFRNDVEKAYSIIAERGIVDDGELQYLLDVGHATFYRVRRALLAIHNDIEHTNGYFKIKETQTIPKEIPIDFWGELEPDKGG